MIGLRFLLAVSFVAALTAPTASAVGPESGTLTGLIMMDDGDPLPFANVELFRLTAPDDSLGYRIGQTVAEVPAGDFSIVLDEGDYRVVASYVSCLPRSLVPVRVKAGGVTRVELRLQRRVFTLAPIPVRASRIRSSTEAVLASQQQAAAVSDAISSEQMRKAPDSNAADALQRVTGLSTVDSRYVFVRGLGERYSSTLINGAPVSSPEPNRRVLPLDLIPASLLDNIAVQKTFTPDQPGEFGGGTVNINTRDFPGERFYSLSFSGGLRDADGKGDFHTYHGGDLDFVGVDDGTRSLPNLVKSMAGDQRIVASGVGSDNGFTRDEIAEMGKSFNEIWTGRRNDRPPDFGVNGAYGDEIEIFGRTLGLFAGGVLRNAFSQQRHQENTYELEDNGVFSDRTTYDVQTSEVKAQASGLGSLAYRLGDNTRINAHSIFNRVAEDEYRFYEGMNTDHGAPLRDTRLRFLSRSLWATTFGADHRLPQLGDSHLKWSITYSQAAMEEPDRREYQYEWRPIEEEEEEEEKGRTQSGQWELSVRSTSMGFTRMFGELDEKERGFSAEYAIPLGLRGLENQLRVGFQETHKHRQVDYRRFGFKAPTSGVWDRSLPPESLMVDSRIGGSPRDFVLVELTRATDSYLADFDNQASYLMFDGAVLKRLRVLAGARVEDWKQEVATFDAFVPSETLIPAKLQETDVLPCLNLTYALRHSLNLRAAYSRTISRPDIRELSPFELSQYESGWVMQGNPELKRAKLDNYDLRFEHYFGREEMLALSTFYKEFYDPIEITLRLAGAALRQVPENGTGGYLYGAELEGRLGLGRLHSQLSDLQVAGNLTQVESQTRLVKIGWHTSTERPLAGQSPYLYNLMMFYSPKHQRFGGSLLYSRYGRRLDGVGVGGMPDIYEEAHGAVDASAWFSWSSIRWTLSAGNILDGELRWTQGDYTARSMKKGRSVGLSVSHSR